MSAYGKGTAGIGVFECHRPIFAIEPALEQARHETIARAKHIEDLDRKARPLMPSSSEAGIAL